MHITTPRNTLTGIDISDATYAWVAHRTMERDPEVRRFMAAEVTESDIEFWALDIGAVIAEDA